jgi:hypothetical protein
MKLAELSAEVSDPTPEQSDYDVVVEYPESVEQGYLDVRDVRWQHDEKKLVIEV